MKDFGRLSYFLGLEVAFDAFDYNLSQAKYIIDLVSRARLSNNNMASTPIELNAKFNDKDGTLFSKYYTLSAIDW